MRYFRRCNYILAGLACPAELVPRNSAFTPKPATTLREVVDRAAVATWISGPRVVGIVAGIYVALLLLIKVLAALIPEHFDGNPRAYHGPGHTGNG